VHAQGTGPEYTRFRSKLLGTSGGSKTTIRGVALTRMQAEGRTLLTYGNVTLQHTQRNTPSLFGAGLIDKISDATLASLEGQTPLRGPNVTVVAGADGSGTNTGSPTPRRFGWKGQTPTLRDFVAGACANELGLQTKGIPQAANVTDPGYRSDHVDMTPQQLDALVAYVASLPPPKRLQPKSAAESAAITRGAVLFGQAKCQTCHIQDVENVQGIYSDLQLHDMGQALSDPSGSALAISTPRGMPQKAVRPEDFDDPDRVETRPTPPSKVVVQTQQVVSSSERYFGQVSVGLAAIWRTPPLWGVRDSAPYLHDGRAETLQQAIEMHGGEAVESATHFRNLTSADRSDLLAFVNSLGAP
jgi:CxxC motif-containing protein (DUF1111 family)